MADAGLLFVLAECGPDVSESELNDWYDNEHAPARLTVPGFSTATRYKATDGTAPSWLALYDIDSPDVMLTDAYKDLRVKASTNEASIVSRLRMLDRRVYRHLATIEGPDFNLSSPAKFVLAVYMQPTAENDADFNRWYAEEHLGMLSKVPGFIRARRFHLVSDVELAGNPDNKAPKAPLSYLTLYDWDRETFNESLEFKNALATPWSAKVLGEIVGMEMKLFTIHKSFSG